MEEPENIFQRIQEFFTKKGQFAGKKVMVTAGPTHEAIDPVRFIGNHSSGLMGIEIALAFAESGAQVMLVAGPTQYSMQHPAVEVIPVTSADEMAAVAIPLFNEMDIAVLSAAVADYKPAVAASQKIKKEGDQLSIELVRTTDILRELGKQKKSSQILVGFALETENAVQNALKKLHSKNLDLIVVNTLEDDGAGFKHQTNKVSIITRSEAITHFPLKQKKEVAADILEAISMHLNELHNKP
jgi:phosphopantothenoylcysteine decarboxylase/phosphopantothenate--cysteine ligase